MAEQRGKSTRWRWAIMLEFDPDPTYSDCMEDIVVVLVPERSNVEPGDRIEPARVIPWKELNPEQVIDWMIEASFVPGDLDGTIRRLQEHRDSLKKNTEEESL